MTIIQVFIYFNLMLLTYLTTMFEQIYITGLISAASEIGAYVFSGTVFEKLGVRSTYLISLGIATLGGVLIIIYGLDHQESVSFPIFFSLCRFGICSAFNMIVVANSTIFEVKKAATALGTPMFLARLSQSSSPLIATLTQPIPMYIFCVTNTACAIFSYFLKVPPAKN